MHQKLLNDTYMFILTLVNYHLTTNIFGKAPDFTVPTRPQHFLCIEHHFAKFQIQPLGLSGHVGKNALLRQDNFPTPDFAWLGVGGMQKMHGNDCEGKKAPIGHPDSWHNVHLQYWNTNSIQCEGANEVMMLRVTIAQFRPSKFPN